MLIPAALALLCGVVAATSHASERSWADPWENRYLDVYESAHEAGHDVGRNLLDHHWTDADRVPRARVEESTARLERWLNPPAPEPSGTSPAPQPQSSGTGSGGWAIPESIVMCESGGDYNARNPSGAYGAYQIMPGTAAAYGCDLSSASGQDECAARIWNGGAGRSHWVC